jgi:sensor histidine kinase YesM
MEIDSSLHIEEAQIPPMVLQPFVENAIWHGLMPRKAGGVLKIHVRDLGGRIQCLIEDNGIGRERAKAMREEQQVHKQSMGIRITEDRIALINRIYGIETSVQVIDLYNHEGISSGTRVVIDIPVLVDTLNPIHES